MRLFNSIKFGKIFGLLAVVLAVYFVGAPTSHAQNVTQQQLIDVQEKAKELRALDISLSDDERATNQQYLDLLHETWTMCGQIGDAIYGITGGGYSTISGRAGSCQGASVSRLAPPASDEFSRYLNRTYSVEHNASVDAYLAGMRSGTNPTLDATVYKEQQEKIVNTDPGVDVNPISVLLGAIVNFFGNLIASIMAFLATLALSILEVITTASTSAGMPKIVNTGWVIVRDLMNIVFILALIVMALATILRRDTYSYKNLLFQLLLMALLINFSQIIAITLIGVSNMLINMFKPNTSILELGKLIFSGFITENNSWYAIWGQGSEVGPAFLSVITKIISLGVVTIAYLALAGLMLVRMIGLWFLVILSPIAYALRILPHTKEYSVTWWNTFTKYLIWGPVAMFFLKLSEVFIKTKATDQLIITDASQSIRYLLIAGFVYGGYYVARKSGMYGASAITSYADKAISGYPKGVGKLAGNLVWRGNVAGVAKGVAGKFTNKGTFAENYKAGKEAFGAKTARLSNEWSLQKQKWVDDPNAARAKLVKTERRRQIIERDYLKDLDETTAKEFTPLDFAHLLSKGQLNENKLNNLMEHGNRGTKSAIAAAFATGKLSATGANGAVSKEATAEVFEKVRSFVWKDMGREQSDLADHPEFMIGDNLKRDVSLKAKNSADVDKLKDMSFDEQLKKAYIKFDEKRSYRKEKGQNKEITIEDGRVGTKVRTPEEDAAIKAAAGLDKTKTIIS